MTAPVLRDRLQAAAEALGVALDESDAARLLAYLDLLQRWNVTYNLTAVRDPEEMLTQHLVDCLAVMRPLERQIPAGGRRILDVGSGGGLPGIVIATLRPDDQVTCIDTVGKKAAFIRQAAMELRLPNLAVEHARVEQWRSVPFNLVTSRAFASLPDFVRLTDHHLAPDGLWMAMKGKRPEDEIAGLPPDVAMFHVEPLAVPGLAADRCLVWMRRQRS